MRSPLLAYKYTGLLKMLRSPVALLSAALLLAWCVGILGRGYWTPDEPREADIAWRMSWQTDRAVPLLAGEAFCEKPPLTYWLAAVPIGLIGAQAWVARLPNLLYAVIAALSVGLLARRSVGAAGGLVGAAALGTFLLSYQVAIWLATDAPLLAAVSVALLGAYRGFYAASTRERLRGYLLMHAALGMGFLCKSAVAWMVPALALVTLALWEKRWRELLRWELYVGLALQAAMILTWIWFVYVGPDGPAHLKVFFWNNLVGRFTRVDAPNELQYAAAHRNAPGKYLIELPVYLAPWTLLVAAAARRAWLQRKSAPDDYRAVRFALAASLPSLAVLSLAATARNVYFAPALPGAALLLAWWAREIQRQPDPWDLRALRATSMLLLLAVLGFAAALCAIAVDSWESLPSRADFIVISASGLMVAAALALRAWSATPAHGAAPASTAAHADSATPADTAPHAAAPMRSPLQRVQWSLLLAYCMLLVGPASQIYSRVDTWQDLASVARSIEKDAAGKPLILFAADETTRAMIDMYARTDVALIAGPIESGAILRLRAAALAAPQSLIVVQLPGRSPLRGRLREVGQWWHLGRRAPAADAESALSWLPNSGFRLAMSYSLPNGRRYALLALRHDGA